MGQHALAAKTAVPASEPVKQRASAHEIDATEEFVHSRVGYSLAAVPTFAAGDPDETANSRQRNAAYKAGPRLNLQAKLMVGAVNDPLEMEADRVADQVMRMPEPESVPKRDQAESASAANHGAHSSHVSGTLQRKCACGGSCDDCKKHEDDQNVKVQMKANGAGTAYGIEAPPIVHEVLRSPGRPLDSATRAFMEPRFGHDFSKVRIHTDAKAAESAEAVGARAYTVGSSVVFGSGQYGPGASDGYSLIAHELSHVAQNPNVNDTIRRSPDMRWVNDVNAARYRGQLMARRITAHGKLSKEARAKLNAELRYFQGQAKEAYIQQVKPALGSVLEIEVPVASDSDQPKSAPSPPSPNQTPPAKKCERLPEANFGKKCRFYVYDDTLSGLLGAGWKRGAIAFSRVHSDSYAIPSGENMEDMLYNILYRSAEEHCDCIDEIQFWSHGSHGNGAWISQSHGGTTQLESSSFNIPGLEQFGDDPKQPGYREWEEKLSTFQRRLMILRRSICDSNSTIYYRSCQAFQGKEGKEFAKASSDFWRCEVAGHTKN
ncbi:MAG TPA: DUF4157 domain-containing protein, partial [Candidatus Angelobacter sp.]|nr:DUF4157 domain-containing protein [Candidatus Angelobacter sp.]